ncbi:MAG: 16S rRNA (cytosine(967)-C(5))-methyltransferase RsmB [Candidatus Poribacteria bacterium]
MIRKLVLRCLVQLERRNSQIAPVIDMVIRQNQLNNVDRGLLTEIVYGAIRWRGHLDWIIRQFVKPDFQLDLQMRNILRIGVYQLLYLDKIPAHAAINETVKLANQKGQKSKNFVNAILRSIQRSTNSLTPPRFKLDPISHISTKLSYPGWLVKKWIRQSNPEWTLKFCHASNQVAPVSIRTNTLRTDRKKLAKSLQEDGNQVVESQISPDGLLLTKTNPIRSLSDFQAGLFQIQDEAAQLVSHLLDPQEKSQIVDLCASPGGKTTHLAQLVGNVTNIVAIDLSTKKIKRIQENCKRLGITNVRTQVANATTDEIKALATADSILIDAPCSGTGTLRRHPDIRWKRTAKQIVDLANLQLEILIKTAMQIKSGAVIIYSTCSTEVEENQGVITRFLEVCPQFAVEPAHDFLPFLPADAITSEGHLQVFPHTHKVDGTFAVRLRKND